MDSQYISCYQARVDKEGEAMAACSQGMPAYQQAYSGRNHSGYTHPLCQLDKVKGGLRQSPLGRNARESDQTCHDRHQHGASRSSVRRNSKEATTSSYHRQRTTRKMYCLLVRDGLEMAKPRRRGTRNHTPLSGAAKPRVALSTCPQWIHRTAKDWCRCSMRATHHQYKIQT